MHSQHKSDTLPSGICGTKQAPGVFAANLTNSRLKCKGDLLKGMQQTSVRRLLGCWALGDILSLRKAREAHGTVLPSRFSGVHERSRLSEDSGPQTLTVWGESLADPP